MNNKTLKVSVIFIWEKSFSFLAFLYSLLSRQKSYIQIIGIQQKWLELKTKYLSKKSANKKDEILKI